MLKNGTPASPATARARSVLPVPGGPDEQHAARDARAEGVELLGELEELDDLLELRLGLVDARDVGERHDRLVAEEHPRAALAEAQRLVVRALGLAHHEEDEAADDDQRQQARQHQPDPRVVRGRASARSSAGSVWLPRVGRRGHVLLRPCGDRVRDDDGVGRAPSVVVTRVSVSPSWTTFSTLPSSTSAMNVRVARRWRTGVDDVHPRVEQRDRARHEDEHHDPVAQELRVQPERLRVRRAASPGLGSPASIPPGCRSAVGRPHHPYPSRIRDHASARMTAVAIEAAVQVSSPCHRVRSPFGRWSGARAVVRGHSRGADMTTPGRRARAWEASAGSGGRIRTTDQGLMSPLLYH